MIEISGEGKNKQKVTLDFFLNFSLKGSNLKHILKKIIHFFQLKSIWGIESEQKITPNFFKSLPKTGLF